MNKGIPYRGGGSLTPYDREEDVYCYCGNEMCVYEDTLQGPSSYISGWLAQSLHKICLPLVSFWSFKARTQAGMYADLGEKKWIWTRKKFLQCGLFPPSPLKFRNEGWVKNIGAHLRQAGVKAPIYWENKESGRKYFRPVKQNISGLWNRIFLSRETEYFCPLENILWKKRKCPMTKNVSALANYISVLWQYVFLSCGRNFV